MISWKAEKPRDSKNSVRYTAVVKSRIFSPFKKEKINKKKPIAIWQVETLHFLYLLILSRKMKQTLKRASNNWKVLIILQLISDKVSHRKEAVIKVWRPSSQSTDKEIEKFALTEVLNNPE